MRSDVFESTKKKVPTDGVNGTEINEFLKIVPAVQNSPGNYLWSFYDAEADVPYVDFKKPSHATDSEITDNDIVVRYENADVIGVTVRRASKR